MTKLGGKEGYRVDHKIKGLVEDWKTAAPRSGKQELMDGLGDITFKWICSNSFHILRELAKKIKKISRRTTVSLGSGPASW